MRTNQFVLQLRSRLLRRRSAPGSSVHAARPAATGGCHRRMTLIAAAKAEGTLTTIALPHDWCNYGEVIETFKTKYGLTVNELNPDAGSGDEIEAIRANKDNKGPQAPDVIDVGFAFGPSSKAEGLLQPYKVATWDTIPADSQGCRWLLVRRLLRRAGLHGQQGCPVRNPAGLG